jgi:hypothetical protein
MTSIGLITLFRQATQAAREGDANTFAQIRASIDTLDRMGEISREELDLLTIVASARLGDTEQARSVLKRFGSLSTTQQQDLFNWLGACPEMAHTRFREFVLELRVSARAPRMRMSFLRSRSLSLSLAALTLIMLIGVVMLIQFVLPKSAITNTKNILAAVSNANPPLLWDSLPNSWRTALQESALRVGASPADPTADQAALQKSFRNLGASLIAAHASPQAKNICKLLVGSDADTDILNRLAAGVSDISNCEWMNAWMWKDQPPWKSTLSADAVLVWRTLLAHAPISQWSDALFDSQERIMPSESSVFYVSETSDLAPKKLLLVQGRTTSWQLACVQVDGVWVPMDWEQDWARCEPWISGKNSPAYPLSQLETTLADRINGVASWLTRSTQSSTVTTPTEKEASWWIGQ